MTPQERPLDGDRRDITIPPAPVIEQPQPESERTLERRPHWATPLVRGWMVIAAAAFILFKQLLEDGKDLRSLSVRELGIGGSIIVVVAILQVIVGAFVWATTRFHIDEDEVRIEHRFITHESDRLALSKIQGIDVVQPFAARIVGLASLNIDVGASNSKKIEFLKRGEAYELRDLLISRARHEIAQSHTDAVGDGVGSQWWDQRRDEHEIVNVTAKRALVAGFLSMTFLIQLLALIVSIVISVANDQPLGVAAILALLLTMIGVVWKQLDAAWKFSLLRSAGALKAVHGLTSLTTRTVPVRRVQAVEVSTPLLWRPLGVSRITMTVLGGAGLSDVEQSTVLLPIGDDEQVRAALDALWPGFRLDSVHLNGIPKRARWFRWFDQTVIAWGFDDEVVVTRKGLFNRTLSIVPHARSQSVRLAQGPLQRRLGLADVYVHTSSGPVTVSCSHLDAPDARTFVMGQMDRTRAARARELSPTEHPATAPAVSSDEPIGARSPDIPARPHGVRTDSTANTAHGQ